MVKETIQPEVNIGLVGHVDHGKTTLTQRLSGKWTDTHSEELKRGITIRLGYANVSIYKYKDGTLGVEEKRGKEKGKLVRKISLVDAPGHETLMATMLSGATIMDGAILLVAANEKCPQPQTREHIVALQISGIKNVIIVQNKIDLVTKEEAIQNFEEVRNFISQTDFKDAPIIPISALHNANIDLLLQKIEEFMPTPKRDPKKDPIMYIARSFDINKPGSKPKVMKGGVLGGSLKEGILKIGQEIEIKPGRKYTKGKQVATQVLKTKITGLMTGSEPVKEIKPGGSMAIMTELDPSIVGGDRLTGCIVGFPDKLPPVWESLVIKPHLLKRVVGAKDDLLVKSLTEGEVLLLNVNSAATVGVISNLKKGKCFLNLKVPVCAAIGDKVTISRNVGNRWRLIGYGIIEEK